MLLRYLAGTLSITATLLVLAIGFMGIGIAIRRGFGLRSLEIDDCLMAFWIGFGGVILFLILWNFFLPVSGFALAAVVAAGGAGLLGARRELPRVFERTGWRPTAPVVTLLALAAFWVANLSLGSLSNLDSALYHIQGVAWAKSYAAVPGVANLYGPLGFNNSSFLYAAMLDSGLWAGRGNHLANGLLILVILVQVLISAARLTGVGAKDPRHLFGFLLLAPVLNVSLNGRISSFVTDLPTSVVLMVVTSRLYALLASPGTEPQEEAYGIVCLATLLATAVTLKMNAAIFAVVCMAVSLLIWLRRHSWRDRLARKTLAWAVMIPIGFGLAWMARGVVLSGYPLFPSTAAPAPVDWRAPAEHAAAEFAYIVHSGRGSTENIAVVSGQESLAGWLPDWIRHTAEDPFDVVVPLLLAGLATGVWLVERRRATSSVRPSNPALWWMLLPVGAAIAAWFAVAPEPRYIMPMFWSLAALTGSELYRVRMVSTGRPARRATITVGFCVGVAPLLISPILYAKRHRESLNPIQAILHYNLKRPGTDLWFQPMADHATLTTFTTTSGLVLNVPERRCWDAPLPCTPNPAPNLRLREPGRMDRGFAVDGDWQMEDWPYSWRPGFLQAWRASRK